MQNINLDTTVKDALLIMNYAVSHLQGTKFTDGYGGFHKSVKNCFNTTDTTNLTDGLELRTWSVVYDNIDIFQYSKDIEEDKRFSRFNVQKGIINTLTFSVVTTKYDHNSNSYSKYPDFNENESIRKLIMNRQLFEKEIIIKNQYNHLDQLKKEITDTQRLIRKKEIQRDLLISEINKL